MKFITLIEIIPRNINGKYFEDRKKITVNTNYITHIFPFDDNRSAIYVEGEDDVRIVDVEYSKLVRTLNEDAK